MQHQASLAHFEFLGLDFIADDSGGVWLLEGERVFCGRWRGSFVAVGQLSC